MTDAIEIEYKLLDAASASVFAGMVTEKQQYYLQGIGVRETVIALGAYEAGEPVGIAIAEIPPSGVVAEVYVLYVLSTCRDQGIGTTLLSRVEQALLQRGMRAVQLHFVVGQTTVPALERVLERLDWAAPQLSVAIYKTDVRMTTMPWLDYDFELPEETEIFSWADLPPEDRPAVQHEVESGSAKSLFVSPFFEEDRIEPINSLGLRYQGQVVGWLITHRVAPGLIRYNSVYIREDLRGLSGAGMAMLIEAIRRHRDFGGHIAHGAFAVRGTNTTMLSIIKKYFMPYVIASSEIWFSCKPKTLKAL